MSRSKFLLFLLGLGLFLGATGAARAQVVIYGADYNSGQSLLYSIDSTNWSATLVGPTSQYLEALAISPTGQLFATNTNGDLLSLNPATGASTLIGNTGRGNIEALDFNGTTLLGATFSGSPVTVFSIDTTTGVTTDLVTLNTGLGTIRSIAALDANTLLLRSDGSPSQLSSLNLTTGVVTPIGPMSTNGSLYGFDLAPSGALYGLDSEGSVWSVNPTTGATLLLGDTGSQLWLGMTIQAIPEPSTYALLALGGGLLLVARRRRA